MVVAATPPIVTVAGLKNPVPVMVMGVPDKRGPEFGDILAIVGIAA
jgi:hypothetical protein